MFNKLLFALSTFILSINVVFAAVEVNKATAAQLDSVKGIGPATSKAIIDERGKGGEFKDWNDLQNRVKGIGEKSSAKMSEAGLTVAGKPYAATSVKEMAAKPEEKKPSSVETKVNKEAKPKKEEKAEAKK